MARNSNLYILWNPNSQFPPKRVWTHEPDAQGIARTMAKKNPGEEFYVMRAASKVLVVPGNEPEIEFMAAHNWPTEDESTNDT